MASLPFMYQHIAITPYVHLGLRAAVVSVIPTFVLLRGYFLR